jgi:hypothetical protein
VDNQVILVDSEDALQISIQALETGTAKYELGKFQKEKRNQ